LLKRIVSGIMLILLLISTLTLAFHIQPVKAEPTTIVVPDDYPTIQEAINAATPGDTIFVRAETYYENVVVNKTVSLIGEDKTKQLLTETRWKVFSL
jgi:pectin methylesterase-like acyl-CoA thioesterase